MTNHKGDVSGNVSKGVKYHPGRYPYAVNLKIYLRMKGVRISTLEKTLQQYGVSPDTIHTFLSGSHVPNSWLSHLVEDIYGFRFHHEDFEEEK